MAPIAFALPWVLSFLVWLALAAMTFWVWKGTKATSTLLTMIGAALLALSGFLAGFGISYNLDWPLAAGAVLVVLGYYYTVKPIVDARVRELKEKAKEKAKSATSSGSGTPSHPPAPPSS